MTPEQVKLNLLKNLYPDMFAKFKGEAWDILKAQPHNEAIHYQNDLVTVVSAVEAMMLFKFGCSDSPSPVPSTAPPSELREEGEWYWSKTGEFDFKVTNDKIHFRAYSQFGAEQLASDLNALQGLRETVALYEELATKADNEYDTKISDARRKMSQLQQENVRLKQGIEKFKQASEKHLEEASGTEVDALVWISQKLERLLPSPEQTTVLAKANVKCRCGNIVKGIDAEYRNGFWNCMSCFGQPLNTGKEPKE